MRLSDLRMVGAWSGEADYAVAVYSGQQPDRQTPGLALTAWLSGPPSAARKIYWQHATSNCISPDELLVGILERGYARDYSDWLELVAAEAWKTGARGRIWPGRANNEPSYRLTGVLIDPGPEFYKAARAKLDKRALEAL